LEVITNIAQRIENENRALMKKNAELKKEYENQENDRELLLKQLVMLKKENSKVKEEIDYYNKIVEENKEEEEEVPTVNSPNKSPEEQPNSRTLLNSRKSQRRGDNLRGTESMRQSANTLNIDSTSKMHEIGGGYYQKPQETEEDKIHRYERIIDKLKKTLEFERK
jgi:predicted phage gp36 major capsid-like protein